MSGCRPVTQRDSALQGPEVEELDEGRDGDSGWEAGGTSVPVSPGRGQSPGEQRGLAEVAGLIQRWGALCTALSPTLSLGGGGAGAQGGRWEQRGWSMQSPAACGLGAACSWGSPTTASCSRAPSATTRLSLVSGTAPGACSRWGPSTRPTTPARCTGCPSPCRSTGSSPWTGG